LSTNDKTAKGRVLVADDDPAILRLVTTILEKEGFAVVGAAIDNLTDDTYRKHAAEKIAEFSRTQPVDQPVLQSFLESVSYVKVDFSKAEDFKALARKLDQLDHARHVGGNRVFYCATPPPTRTAYFCEPYTTTCATPLIIEMRSAR